MKHSKKVKFDLTSVDGNAFSLMGNFRKHAQRAGWSRNEIDEVLRECMSSDYDHLVQTLIEHCE